MPPDVICGRRSDSNRPGQEKDRRNDLTACANSSQSSRSARGAADEDPPPPACSCAADSTGSESTRSSREKRTGGCCRLRAPALPPRRSRPVYVAGRSASRGSGFSSMGMWTMAANTPKKIPAHHIMSYEPVRSVEHATQPHAEEAPDLMAEEHHAKECRHELQAEYLRHDGGGQRDRGEPQEPHCNRKGIDRDLADRCHHEPGDHQRAAEVDDGERRLLAEPLADDAGDEGAQDVDQPDNRQRIRTHVGGEGRYRSRRRESAWSGTRRGIRRRRIRS